MPALLWSNSFSHARSGAPMLPLRIDMGKYLQSVALWRSSPLWEFGGCRSSKQSGGCRHAECTACTRRSAQRKNKRGLIFGKQYPYILLPSTHSYRCTRRRVKMV